MTSTWRLDKTIYIFYVIKLLQIIEKFQNFEQQWYEENF